MKDNEVTGGTSKNYTINYGENLFISQGWQCPVCKRVMSPFTSYCLFCNNINNGTYV